MSKTRTLTRNDLYEIVWSTPMRKLATEFGFPTWAWPKFAEKMEYHFRASAIGGLWKQATLQDGHHFQ
jgi:hypothetical protein